MCYVGLIGLFCGRPVTNDAHTLQNVMDDSVKVDHFTLLRMKMPTLFDHPHFSAEFCKQSAVCLASAVWNILPLDTRLFLSIDTVECHLKTYLYHAFTESICTLPKLPTY